jgi:hypothetical protein
MVTRGDAFNVNIPSNTNAFIIRSRLSFARTQEYGFDPEFALSNSGSFEVGSVDGHRTGTVSFFALSETFADANTPWGVASVNKCRSGHRFEVLLGGSRLALVSSNLLHTRTRLVFPFGKKLVFKTRPFSENMCSLRPLGGYNVAYEGIHRSTNGRISLWELRREWNRYNSSSTNHHGPVDAESSQSDSQNVYYYQWRISLPNRSRADDRILVALVMLVSYSFLSVAASSTQAYGPLAIIFGQSG